VSLRLRLVLGMAVVAIVLVATAVTITRSSRSYLVGQLDDQLRAAATPGRDFGFGQGICGPQNGPGPDRRGFSSLYVAVRFADGTTQACRIPNLSTQTPALPKLDARELRPQDRARILTVGSTSSSLRYRVLLQSESAAVAQDPGSVPQQETITLIIALPLGDIDSSMNTLVHFELVATFVILGLLALVTFWVLRLGVRPIKAMTATATAIAGGDLSHRVPDVRSGTEAGELGQALNAMLGRIEESFAQKEESEARLRRFAADASHELRTPVTTIRGYAELYRRGGLDGPGQLADAMRRTEDEATRMGRLIEDLLLLARLDQGRPLDQGPVDLATIARDAAADARAVQPERTVTATVAGPVVVTGDDGRLRQVVANLVGNALVHTPPSAAVEILARLEGDLAVLEVRDAGPGMAPDVAQQVFERFYRADPARARNQGGSGLGLSITESIVAAHGGRVLLQTAPGAGTAMRIELPLPGAEPLGGQPPAA